MRKSRLAALIAVLIWMSPAVFAGGIHLSDAAINEQSVSGVKPARLGSQQEANLCFNLEGYSYSGRPGEPSYAVFSLKRKGVQTEASVFVKRFEALNDRRTSSDEFEIRHCVAFYTPKTPGSYVISYSPILMFPSNYSVADFSNSNISDFARRHISSYGVHILQDLCTIQVSLSPELPANVITYLRLNGEPPGSAARIKAGIDVPPVEFSWFLKPNVDSAEHRFRLFPVETEWSPWSKDTKALYFFMAAGSYQFQVMSRMYTDGHWKEGDEARYQFFLEKPLIAKPIPKASGGTVSSVPSVQDLTHLYGKSRALVFGINQYQDHRFGPLPFVKNDVERMSSTLEQLGFQVNSQLGPVTKSQLTQQIDQFARSASREERLVIYLSTHGFADPLDPAKGFVATSDCNQDRPSTCVSLDEIDGLLEPVLKATTQPVRHLLVLLDTCSSGLGVISKTGRFNELSVA